MSDMGWTRYISSLDDAADQEMQADEKVAKLIADEGVRSLLAKGLYELQFASMPMIPSNMVAEVLWAAAGMYCIRHSNPQRWHPTLGAGPCSADETCPTCKSEPLPAPGFGCVACSYYNAPPLPSILTINDPISHTHDMYVVGCFRCELSKDEAQD